MRAALEDTVEITKNIIRGYYQGNMEPWFSRLCTKSIWMGTGERLLIGGDAIRSYFNNYVNKKPSQIVREEYYPVPINSRCGAVAAEITLGTPAKKQIHVSARYSFLYQVIASETKLVLLHAGYEFIRSLAPRPSAPILELSAYQFVRDILLGIPEAKRLAVPSGNRTLFIQPHMIFYVQSRNRKAELHCADTIIESDLSINALNAMLPPDFCPVHRCYTVNTHYVTSIHRYEVTMITGEALPVPMHSYNKIKTALEHRIIG